MLTSLYNPAPFHRRELLLDEKETRKYSAVFSKQVTHVLKKWSDLNQGNKKCYYYLHLLVTHFNVLSCLLYRYLLCEVCVPERNSLQLLDERAIHHTLRAAVNRAHGDYGSALFNIGVIGKQKCYFVCL